MNHPWDLATAMQIVGGRSHAPPSPEPDREGEADLPGQDDDPRLAPLQERKERDAQRHLHEEGTIPDRPAPQRRGV